MTSINNQEKKGGGLLSGGKFGGANAPGNVASPVPSNPEHLPTGYLPTQAQAAPAPNGKGAGLLSGQANNLQAPNKGLLNNQPNTPQPPANKGLLSKQAPNIPQPPSNGLLGGQAYAPVAPPQPQPPAARAPFNNGGALPQQPGPRGPINPAPGGPGHQGAPGPQHPGNSQRPSGKAPVPAKNAPSGPTGQVVLYRNPNFYVRTTIHPNKRPSTNPLRKPTGNTTMMPKVIPNQEQRMAESETRMMPALDVPENAPRRKFYIPAWFETVVVALGVLASVIAHAYNLFNYPRYEMDEGTYMSAAWAVTTGKIYPYAYGYGHPPFAWMQLAGLVQLIGGFFVFDNAIDTGRVLMLLYTLGSTLLVYLIIRRTSDSRSAGLLAMAIFAFSPLAINFQRLVLLDNIATFWFLLSLYLLVINRSRLPVVVAAAICFGLAFLSKEVLALFLPGMIYGIWIHSTKFQRKFALVAFTYGFIAIASLWVLMAVLKGELFPPGWFPWDKGQHLSFIGTFTSQVGRDQTEGKITTSIIDWYSTDPILVILSIVSLAFNVLVGWWKRKQLFFAILGISFWILLIRGGVVFPFYFIPLIPLVAMNAGLMFNTLMGWVGAFVRFDLMRAFLIFCALSGFVFYDATHSEPDYQGNATSVQKEAIAWIRTNVPRNSYVVMNSYLYMELRAPGGSAVGNGAVFPNADVFINIATDPSLIKLEGSNWDHVDYIVADLQVEQYIASSKLPKEAYFLKQALLQHSGPIDPDPHNKLKLPIPCATFTSPDGSYQMHVYCVRHTHANPIALAPPGGNTPLPDGGTIPVDRRLLMG